jgi:hypothetical protein
VVARHISPEQMLAVIGKFPPSNFAWEYVEEFVEETPGCWQPYAFDEILPGPSILVKILLGP